MIKKFNDIINEVALSKQRAENAKIALLVQTAKEMIDYYNKAEEFENTKRIKNAEIEAMLDDMKKTSIIASGVLIEVIKPYEASRLDSKEYTAFVESSIDNVSEEYKKMHQKAIELNTKLSKETKYLKFAKNSKALPTGEMTYESILDTVKTWFTNFKKSLSTFLKSFKSDLADIKTKAKSFQAITEKNKPSKHQNKNDEDSLSLPERIKWKNKEYRNACIAYGSNPTEENLNILNKIERQSGRKLTTHDSANIKESVDTTNNVDDVVKVLEKAKEIIETADQEKYFLELAKVKEIQVLKMLEEFKAKAIVIDDKIVQLIKIAPKDKLSAPDYAKYMTNAELVGDAVSEMATNLFAIYSKTSQVSGSVRQYADDSESPDGTFNAHFDYEKKKVKLANESFNSIITDVANRIKRFFTNFRIASKKVDAALENIQIN